jgi:uncharacterized delta-60 repeat protein
MGLSTERIEVTRACRPVGLPALAFLALCCCLVPALGLLAFASPAAAGPKRSGRLDPSFGRAGWTVTAPGAAGASAGAEPIAAPDGSVVVTDGLEGKMVRLLPDGSVDRSFGRDGRLVVGLRALDGGVRTRFLHVAQISVDGRGRVLVFGDQQDNAHTAEGSGDLPRVPEQNAVVLRFDPDGKLDPSFGEGRGFIRSGFGLTSPYSSEVPLVGALAGGVDSRDRPVLIAGVTEPSGGCYGHGYPMTAPRAVVRLTTSGQLDPTFGGGDGISPIEGSATVPSLGTVADDGIVVSAGKDSADGCRRGTILYRLGPGGGPVAGFGSGGALVERHFRLAEVEPSGAMILAGGRGDTLGLARLLPDGKRDMSFGDHGLARIVPPHAARASVGPAAVDGRGRILLVGLLKPPRRGRHGEGQGPGAFMVGRLLADGRPDPTFGRHGWIITRFPGSLEVTSADGTLDDQGRLVVAGSTAGHGPYGGFVIARYLLGL